MFILRSIMKILVYITLLTLSIERSSEDKLSQNNHTSSENRSVHSLDSNFEINHSHDLSRIRSDDYVFNLNGNLRKHFASGALIDNADNITKVCSPVAALIPLAKLALGAEGHGQKDLETVIGVKDKHNISPLYRDLIRELATTPGIEFDLAVRIYVSNDTEIHPDFEKESKEAFNSAVEKADFFNKNQTAATINSWGKWAEHFNVLTYDIFYTPNSDKLMLMMSRQSYYEYTNSDHLKAQIIKIPYEGHKASFIIVLPYSRNGLMRVLAEIRQSPDIIKNALIEMKNTSLSLNIPKFRVATKLDLKREYKKMNVDNVFGQIGTGLTKIVQNKELSITDAVQIAGLEIHETGDIATAINTLDIAYEPLETDGEAFHANHPFLFYVDFNGEQLFAGTYYGPTE